MIKLAIFYAIIIFGLATLLCRNIGGGVEVIYSLITLIIIPILVGLVIELVSMLVARWLDEKDDN
ncbi:hypothetical protein RyT2_28160 [Pseudolactococcus yaeyamensis]